LLHDLNKPPSDPALRDAWVTFRDNYYAEKDKKSYLVLPPRVLIKKQAPTTLAQALLKPVHLSKEERRQRKTERSQNRNKLRIKDFLDKIVCPYLCEEEYQAPCCKLIRLICSKSGRPTSERKCNKCQYKNA